MKNLIVFTFLLAALSSTAQSFSSGVVPLKSSLGTSIQLDIDPTTNLVTMTLVGPETRWFGVGFNVDQSAMVEGTDCVYVTNGQLEDGLIVGFRRPTVDASQDWTEISNTVSNGVRTVVATRLLDTGDTEDYVFSSSPSSLGLIYANGRTETSAEIGGHSGDENAGATTAVFNALSISEQLASQFEMFPNPVSNEINLKLPQQINSGSISIFDYSGKMVANTVIDHFQKRLDISSLQTGIYLVNFDTPQGSIAKKLMKL